jgi:hypothetical protein
VEGKSTCTLHRVCPCEPQCIACTHSSWKSVASSHGKSKPARVMSNMISHQQMAQKTFPHFRMFILGAQKKSSKGGGYKGAFIKPRSAAEAAQDPCQGSMCSRMCSTPLGTQVRIRGCNERWGALPAGKRVLKVRCVQKVYHYRNHGMDLQIQAPTALIVCMDIAPCSRAWIGSSGHVWHETTGMPLLTRLHGPV